MDNAKDLRRQLVLKKSLQVLEQSSDPIYHAASPLFKEAGTPSPYLPKVKKGGNTEEASPFQSPSLNDSMNRSYRSPLLNSHRKSGFQIPSFLDQRCHIELLHHSFTEEAPEKNNSSFLSEREATPEEPGANLFEEFMQLYSHHPHSADVFELIGQYEEVCRKNIKSLLEYINKHDPARRRLKKRITLLNQLYQECYTWRLIGSLLMDRLLVETQQLDQEMTETPALDSSRSEKLIVEHLFQYESSTRQCQIIVDWLEKNMQDKLEDLLATENLHFHSDSQYWEHTIHDLSQIRMGSKDSSMYTNLVTEADPDAPLRQNRNLSKLDQQDEDQLLLYMFRFIRAGKLEEAQKLCCDQGHYWRAATLDGWRLWHDPNFFANEAGEEVLPAEGNPDRDLWKINCWSLSEQKSCHLYEKAMYAALSGYLSQLLPACVSWDDCVWAYFKVMVDLRVEQEIRNYPRSSGDFADLPKAYWDQIVTYDLTPKGIMDQLNASPNMDIRKQCNDRYKVVQSNIILNNVDELLVHLNSQTNSEDIHFVRFMAHLVLFLQCAGIQTNEEICVKVLQKYVEVLIENKQNSLVAAYTARLPPELQVEIYAKFLEGFEDQKSREMYLELAEEAGLELKLITKQIVENIRMKDLDAEFGVNSENETQKINSIDWLIYDSSQRAEAMKQANAIIRGFLAAKNHDSARAVFGKIPSDAIDVIHKQWRKRAGEKPLPPEDDNAIREYLCIKAYLQAHMAFNAWFQHYHHDSPVEPARKADCTFREQISYEEHVKEYEVSLERWQKSLGAHVNSTKESVYNVLLFPGGWMCDQREVPEANEDGRQQQLSSLRQLCLPYLTFLLHSVLQSAKLFRECIDLAEVIQSKQYKLYEVFQKEDLRKFLLLIRESSIALLNEGYDPFGFQNQLHTTSDAL